MYIHINNTYLHIVKKCLQIYDTYLHILNTYLWLALVSTEKLPPQIVMTSLAEIHTYIVAAKSY